MRSYASAYACSRRALGPHPAFTPLQPSAQGSSSPPPP
nr:MAG TPA: hypothetical protein [Caudoviricetes sp.]